MTSPNTPRWDDDVQTTPIGPISTIPQGNKKTPKLPPNDGLVSCSFRIHDTSIKDDIHRIASQVVTTANKVAEALILAGLTASNEGKIDWSKLGPARNRLELKPPEKDGRWIVYDKPITTPHPLHGNPRRYRKLTPDERREDKKAYNLRRLQYRLHPETAQALDILARKVAGYEEGEYIPKRDGRKGEVLTILLRFGIKAFEEGRINMFPPIWVIHSR